MPVIPGLAADGEGAGAGIDLVVVHADRLVESVFPIAVGLVRGAEEAGVVDKCVVVSPEGSVGVDVEPKVCEVQVSPGALAVLALL
jgi:hypothetical protein